MLDQIDKQYITGIFNEYSQEYLTGGESMGWEGTQEQELRFKILTESIGIINGESLLDLGCGVGDLYDYIKMTRGFDIKYRGIDLFAQSIDKAIGKFGNNGLFSTGEISHIACKEYDYVIASGIFAVKIPDAKAKYFDLVRDMYIKSNKGIAFNMLRADYPLKDYPEIIQFDIGEVVEFCKTLSARVTLIKDYLPIDFTISLHHE